MSERDTSEAPQQRSTFVTVLSWIFIALSGVATLISLRQNLMIWLVISPAELKQTQAKAAAEGMPAFVVWLLGHMELWFLGFMVVCLVTLVASIGLLCRLNWARTTFIVVMSFGIAQNVLALAMVWMTLNGLQQPSHIQIDGFRTLIVVMQVVSLTFAAGICFLFGWIIKRLVSPAIKREFEVV